jgi:hypothetical protein
MLCTVPTMLARTRRRPCGVCARRRRPRPSSRSTIRACASARSRTRRCASRSSPTWPFARRRTKESRNVPSQRAARPQTIVSTRAPRGPTVTVCVAIATSTARLATCGPADTLLLRCRRQSRSTAMAKAARAGRSPPRSPRMPSGCSRTLPGRESPPDLIRCTGVSAVKGDRECSPGCNRSATEIVPGCNRRATRKPPNIPEKPRTPSPACHTGRCFSPSFAVLRER